MQVLLPSGSLQFGEQTRRAHTISKPTQREVHAVKWIQHIHPTASKDRFHFQLGNGDKPDGTGDIRGDPSRRERI